MRLSVLIFLKNNRGELLLLERNKAPNQGLWSPVGGKVEMALGESPFECACREVQEETGLKITNTDLHLFGMVTEKNYEHVGHWLLFLFDCKKAIDTLPAHCDEGTLRFYPREAIDQLPIAPSDRDILWKLYDNHRQGFSAWNLAWDAQGQLTITQESY